MSDLTFTIDKRFSSSVERTDRVLEVAEEFGLGLSKRDFVLYDNFEITVRQGDLIYITGQSGSGKSLLLAELSKKLAEAGKNVTNIEDIPLTDQPLVDQIGRSTADAMRLLSKAGLNDAYLFIRKPSELSDGQRYRFRLAKMIESGAEVWVADEFAAILDRVTATAVAYNIRRLAASVGATVIVATTHTDLKQDLSPSIYVEKRFREQLKVEIDGEESVRIAE